MQCQFVVSAYYVERLLAVKDPLCDTTLVLIPYATYYVKYLPKGHMVPGSILPCSTRVEFFWKTQPLEPVRTDSDLRLVHEFESIRSIMEVSEYQAISSFL